MKLYGEAHFKTPSYAKEDLEMSDEETTPTPAPQVHEKATLSSQRNSSQRDPLHQLHGALATHGDNNITKSLRRETGFTVREVILHSNVSQIPNHQSIHPTKTRSNQKEKGKQTSHFLLNTSTSLSPISQCSLISAGLILPSNAPKNSSLHNLNVLA